MTNAMIILMESISLLEQGILKGTGEKIQVAEEDGTIKELDLPEEIHTYNAWKSKGYQVKKGEKAIAKFPIWKYTSGRMKTEEVRADVDVETNENKAYCFLKVAAFFTRNQVEPVE